MFGSWIVSSLVRLNVTGIGQLEKMAGAASAADLQLARLTGNVTPAEAAFLRYGKAVNAARDAQMGMLTMGAAAGFVAIGAGIAYAAVQAANLQRTLIAIKNETGAGPAAMSRFYDTTFKVADIMGVAPTEGARVMLDISRLTAGQLTTAQMQAIAPLIAGFASTISFHRPDISVDDATKAGLQLAHLFRAYTPQALDPLMDQVYRLSGLMAESPGQAVRQMSYFVPLFKGLNIDDSTSVAMMALLDRAGFRMKVGTNVRAMVMQALGPLQLTSHQQEGKFRQLEQMGVFDRSGKFAWNTPSGSVDFIGMLMQLAKWSQGEIHSGVPRSQVAKTIYGTFGMQGGNIAELMSDPKMVAFLKDVIQYQRNPAVSLAAGELNRQGSMSYQAGRAWGNLNAVTTELGYRATWLTDDFKKLADSLHDTQQWLHAHRQAEDWIGAAVAGLGGFLGIVAGVGGVAQALKFLGIIEAMPNAFMLTIAPIRALLVPLSGLGPAAYVATGPVAALAGLFDKLGGASSAFMSSALGKALGAIAAGYQISMAQQTAATAAYDSIAKKYGVRYANYLLHGGPVDLVTRQRDAIGGWPYNYDPGQIPKGAFSPHDWNLLNPKTAPFGKSVSTPRTSNSTVSFNVRNTFNITGVDDPKEIAKVVADLFSDPQHLMGTSAFNTRTHPNIPVPLSVAPA